MAYTTQQLIQILDQELRATWKGERVLLSSSDRLSNPVIAKALGAEKLSKVFAYQDFQRQIHQYQQDHRVSGLVWRQCEFRGNSVRLPELHHQLISVPGDKEVLVDAKSSVLDFWWQSTTAMSFWQAGHDPRRVEIDYVARAIDDAEWLEVTAGQDELYLSLCWGNPKECHYQWAWPESRCERIIAAPTTPRLTNL